MQQYGVLIILKKAFTLSELIVVMVILSIIILAVVPFIKNKQLKVPRKVAEYHGVVECYYDDSGKLHSFVADNRNNKTGKDTTLDVNYCDVTVPQAHYYNIIVIGAGGNGGRLGSEPSLNSSFSAKTGDTSYVLTDTNFFNNITYAPQWVRDVWEELSPPIIYTLETARGPAGTDAVARTYDSRSECISCSLGGTCPDGCVLSKTCNGGKSGKGLKARIEKRLNIDDSVAYDYYYYPSTTDNYLRIGDSEIYLTKAGYGDNANLINGRVDCVPGSDGEGSAVIDSTGDFEIEETGKNSEQSYDNGRFSSSPPFVSYSTKYRKYSVVVAAQSGAPGNVINKIFEMIPNNTLRLIPAKSNTNSSQVQYFDTTTSAYTTFLQAAGGANGEDFITTDSEDKYWADENMVFPGLQPDYPEKFDVKKIDTVHFSYNQNLKSKIKTLSYVPGSSGYGLYPIILRSGVKPQIARTFNGEELDYAELTESTNGGSYDDDKCLGDREIQEASNGTQYCPSTEGYPGAVLIVW